jgi:hypothetical protein
MKLVIETLNELYKFEKKSDPLVSLNVGKKVLIEKWLKEMYIENYTINDNYTISTRSGVDLSNRNLKKLPDYIKFAEVFGYFDCDDNNLISLEGCPEMVMGNFYCANNKLTSLEGCPEFVKKDFHCEDNKVQFTREYVEKMCNVRGFIKIK